MGGGEGKPRKGRVKRPSNAKDIQIPKSNIQVETIPMQDSRLPDGWKDVEVPLEIEQCSDEGIYECLPDDSPIGPANANYPDVKLTML